MSDLNSTDATVRRHHDAAPLLEVRDLRVTFRRGNTSVRAVDRLGFQLRAGERLGIVGESGSGKSVTALAILRLVEHADIEGEIRFDGRDLLRLSEEEMRQIRGTGIGYVFQDPLSALDPVRTVGDQVAEVLRLRGVSKRVALARARDVLGRVGIKNPAQRMNEYPHEFSGGMRQRVVIAMAIVGEPKVLIADEPTTALDVRVQEKVLDLIMDLVAERELAVILTTHDLGVLAGFAERVLVMYSGRCVEQCSVDDLFYAAIHPYSRGLIGSVPKLEGSIADKLVAIPGNAPSPTNRPRGCAFHTRCAYTGQECRSCSPELLIRPGTSHPAACHKAGRLTQATR